MVFNRRTKSKVKWQKQVSKVRKDTKEQLNRVAQDQPSAVSDLSATIYTNGSEVDAIGAFGRNDAYAAVAADSFTLGNLTTEFEAILDYDPIDGGANQRVGHNVGHFAEDDTYDNTFDSQGQGSNLLPISTNGSGYTGDAWGNQGSYRVQGLENASDVVGPSVDMGSASYNNTRERYNSNIPNDERMHAYSDDYDHHGDNGDGYDDDNSTYKLNYKNKYFDDDDYGIRQPVRQSPIMVLYDTILSHPALTCIALPCIPCLAVYVKVTDRNAPDVAPRRTIRKKGKMKIEDDSKFSEYNAVRSRIEDISRDESRSDMNTGREGKPKSRSNLKSRIRSLNSTHSEFSALNSNPGKRRTNSRGTAEFSEIQSRGRPDSRGMSPRGKPSKGTPSQGMRNEHSNIAYGRPPNNYQRDDNYDPRTAYDNFGGQYSLSMDADDRFVQNVPQGEWNGVSMDETPMDADDRSGGTRSIGWNLDQDSASRGPSVGVYGVYQASFDITENNQGFWNKANGTFSMNSGQGRGQRHANSSYGNTGGWNNKGADSFSQQGYGANNYMGNENDTYGSSTGRGGSGNYYGPGV